MPPSANLFVERIFDATGFQVNPFPADEQLTRDAVRNGAHIGSNSWGSDVQGEYDTDASQFDELVRDADALTPGDQPFILIFAAGNAGSGSQTLDSPASGKNVLSVGASQNVPGTLALTYGLYADGPDAMADFSSRGPCQDGRVKPDVVAPGTWISSLASSAAANLDSVVWMTNDQYYVYMGGTSMACPHASGAAAIFVQYFKATHANTMPSPALVKAALINSADELDQLNGGPGPIPNNDEGWGRISLTNIIATNLNSAVRYYDYVDQSVLLTNNQVSTRHLLVQSAAQPLKVTLAYTDVAGFPGALPALVNDPDLEVVTPDGTLYRGNQMAASESIPNAAESDGLNNVEAVHLAQPDAGRLPGSRSGPKYRCRRAAWKRPWWTRISLWFPRATWLEMGTAAMLLDRTSYPAPGLVAVAGARSRPVGQRQHQRPAEKHQPRAPAKPTPCRLRNTGSFTGTVATIVGTAAVDGRLQIHHGDTIEADYGQLEHPACWPPRWPTWFRR